MNYRFVLLFVVWVMFVLAACTEGKAPDLAAPKSSVFVSPDVWTAQKGSVVAKGQDGFNMSSNLKKCNSGGKTQGIFVLVPAKVETQVSGNKIKVSVIAKGAPSGSGKFGVAYSTAQVGNSGWHTFDPTSEYKVYSFEYSVPKMKKANGDYIGVWADTQGKGRGIVVKSAYVEIVN